MNIPIRYEWSQQEIVDVAEFFDLIAQAQEKGVEAKKLREAYAMFKNVVPSMSEEKQVFREVDEQLGLSCYKLVKQAKEHDGMIKAN